MKKERNNENLILEEEKKEIPKEVVEEAADNVNEDAGPIEEEETEKTPKWKGIAIIGVLAVVIILLISGVVFLTSKGKDQNSASGNQETTETELENAEELGRKHMEKLTPEPTLEPTPEPTAEPTPEPTPEPVVYEGIDMESTLPGKEWIATFKGIIEEPKFVVFNDETNKKVIVENEGKVEFGKGDTLGVFIPDGMMLGVYYGKGIKQICMYTSFYNELVFEEGYEVIMNQEVSVDLFNNDIKKIGEISCTITPPAE